jgi:hypothetical protein
MDEAHRYQPADPQAPPARIDRDGTNALGYRILERDQELEPSAVTTKYLATVVMPFGRYTGVPVDAVALLDVGYLRWACSTRALRESGEAYRVARDRVLQSLLGELKDELALGEHQEAEEALLAVWRALPVSR